MTASVKPAPGAPAPPSFWPIHAAGLAAAAVATLAFYVVAIGPALEQRRQELALRAQLVEQKRKDESLTAVLAAAAGRIDHIDRRIQESGLELRPASSINQRLDGLTRLAAGHGLRVDSVQPSSPIERGRFIKVPIRLSGGGGFANCVRFLHALRQEFPDTGLASLDLSGNPSSADGEAQFVFELHWFAQPGGAVAAAK